jgi:hypothetical protein
MVMKIRCGIQGSWSMKLSDLDSRMLVSSSGRARISFTIERKLIALKFEMKLRAPGTDPIESISVGT